MQYFKTEIEIIKKIKDNNFNIIAIDGYVGFGKSKLATQLSKELNFKIIHFDKYVNEKDNNYFKNINYKKISHDISDNENIIFEGIQMSKVLNRLTVKPDYVIFCTNEDFITEWKYYIDSETDFKKIIGARVNNVNIIRNLEGKNSIKKIDGFHYELDKYIFEYIPFENSDALYDYNKA